MSLKFGLFLLFAFFSPAGGSEPLGCVYCATPSVYGIQEPVYKRDRTPDDLLRYLMPTESWGDPIFADDCGNLGSERKTKYGERCAVLHLEYEDGRVMHLKGSTSTKQEGYFNYTKEDGANGWAYVCSNGSYCNMRDVAEQQILTFSNFTTNLRLGTGTNPLESFAMITDSFVNMTLAVGPVAKFVGSIFKLMQKPGVGTVRTLTNDDFSD
ncbi:unnamed protein product, partial [Mesorhabditis spiculigera]